MFSNKYISDFLDNLKDKYSGFKWEYKENEMAYLCEWELNNNQSSDVLGYTKIWHNEYAERDLKELRRIIMGTKKDTKKPGKGGKGCIN